ncbi:MAG: methionyl-tRNA formyltransferase [Pseudomonadota bacterium]
MAKPTLLFAGTPDFARASLLALLEAGFRPRAVLTQPDRPAGRGRRERAGPVKRCALEHGLPVLQPGSLKSPEAQADLEALQPDLMIVAAYGLILPQAVLDIPRLGCLNVHASLLPNWRGAAPIQAAILNGDAKTGISLMQMEAGLDTGPVYATAATPIGERETAGELHDRLAALGGELLAARLGDILAGRLDAIPQDDSRSSYAGKITRGDARLDWSAPATDVERQIRAYNPVPGAWFDANGEALKCWEARITPDAAGEPGTVLRADQTGVLVACGEGAVLLTIVQRPGRRRVSGGEYAGQIDSAAMRF